jgi:hypothetical protein
MPGQSSKRSPVVLAIPDIYSTYPNICNEDDEKGWMALETAIYYQHGTRNLDETLVGAVTLNLASILPNVQYKANSSLPNV